MVTEHHSFPVGTDLLVVAVAPVLCMLCWGYVWIGTVLRKSHSRSLRYARWITPYVYSWCGLDVLFLALLAASLEINLPIQWIIENQFGGKAGKVCDKIHTLFNTECIRVDGAVPTGGWCLLAAAILSALLFAMTTNAFGHPALCNQRSGYIQEREAKSPTCSRLQAEKWARAYSRDSLLD